MSLFEKKESITLYSERQKDEFIEKLTHAHIDYDIRIKKLNVFNNKIVYVIKLKADDLKKL